jgi:hypothetical protein
MWKKVKGSVVGCAEDVDPPWTEIRTTLRNSPVEQSPEAQAACRLSEGLVAWQRALFCVVLRFGGARGPSDVWIVMG